MRMIDAWQDKKLIITLNFIFFFIVFLIFDEKFTLAEIGKIGSTVQLIIKIYLGKRQNK